MTKRFVTTFVLALLPLLAFGQSQSPDTNRARIEALLQEMHDAATWGMPTTNGLQLGIAVFNGNSGVKQFRTFTYLYDETNFWIGFFPPHGYRLSLSLQDSSGRIIEKTKEGNEISKPASLIVKAEMRMRDRFDLLPQKDPYRYENPFNLLDCFKVEKAGTNTLTVGATLYKKRNDDGIYEIALPPVSIQVLITQADLDKYKASRDSKR